MQIKNNEIFLPLAAVVPSLFVVVGQRPAAAAAGRLGVAAD